MNEIWLRIAGVLRYSVHAQRADRSRRAGAVLAARRPGRPGAEPAQSSARRTSRRWRCRGSYFATQGNVVVTPVIVALVLVHARQQHAAGGALRRHHAGRRGAPDRRVHRGAHAPCCCSPPAWATNPGCKTGKRAIALLIWLAIAAEYLGWLDPIIATLDSIGIAAGKSRITVWSVLKLLFTLTLFMLVAAWISRWVERRVKRLTNVAHVDAHRHREIRQCVSDRPEHSHGLECRRRRSDRADRAHRRHRLGIGLRLAIDRRQFRQRLRAAHGSLHQAGRCHQPVGTSGTSTENFGWVQELRGRYVVVRDRDGVEMLVPNQQLISNAVINWSYTDPRIRLKLPIRVSYRDDPELALQGPARRPAKARRACCASRAPVSRLMHFSDSGIELELRFWISDPQEGVNNVRSEVNRAIWRLFKEHQITIPMAQREIIVRSAASELD